MNLEQISFKNRVLFFEDELLKMHKDGKRLKLTSAKKQHNLWESIFYSKRIRGGKKMCLTTRAIAVLTGLDELDRLDSDLNSIKLSEILPEMNTMEHDYDAK